MHYLQFDSSDEDEDNSDVMSQCTSGILEPKHPLDRSLNNPNLPVFEIKDQVLDMLTKYQVIIITGNTGCGKSTQIPQFIFDQDPTNNNIICSQPRRLAAQTLAHRVSQELGLYELPNLVGYHVSFDKRQATNTQIFFVTTGILIKLLINNSDKFFKTYTHIIIDEVHERNIEIDFALVIIKNNLKKYPQCRLILMSATISAEKFANYFSRGSIQQVDNDQYIDRLVKTFPIEPVPEEINPSDWAMDESQRKQREQAFQHSQEQFKVELNRREKGMHFLIDQDQAAQIINIPSDNEFTVTVFHLNQLQDFFDQIGSSTQVSFLESQYNLREAYKIEVVMEITLAILESIIQKPEKIMDCFQTEKGSVILFLPGYSEIIQVKEAIENKFPKLTQIVILHSNVRPSNQELMETSHKHLKIFLSTNIAESSITVPGCVYVIDYCLVKENIYESESGNEIITVRYCSRSSCQQRSGRVGRVSNGICFRLVPHYFYMNQMRAYPVCEMMRGRLEKVVLELKRYFEKSANQDQSVRRFLSTAIDAPQIKSIEQFIRNLQQLGALDHDEQLTNLGHFICTMPIDICLSKFVYLCCLFGCPEPGITIAAILGQRKGIFQYHKEKDRQLQIVYEYDNGDDDDIMIQLRVFCEWEELFLHRYESSEENPINKLEKEYLKLKTIDLQSMRSINILKEELQRRIKPYFKFEPEFFDPYDKDLVFKLKSLLAATFMDKGYLISRNNFDLEDMYKLKFDGFTKFEFSSLSDHHKQDVCDKIRALFELFRMNQCLQSKNNIRTMVKETFLKDSSKIQLKDIPFQDEHQSLKPWVINCEYLANSIILQLDPQIRIDDLQFVVKQLIHFTERFIRRKDSYLPQRQQSNQPLKINQNSKDYQTLEQLLIGLGCYVHHMGRSSYYNVGDFKKQDCTYESINHISLNPHQVKDSYEDYLTCFDVRNNSKHIPMMMLTSKLNGNPLWFQTIAAVFAGEAKLLFDKDESYFTSIRINDKFNLPLDRYITYEDITCMNQLRRKISNGLKYLEIYDDVTQAGDEYEINALTKSNHWDELLNLIKRQENKQKIIILESEWYRQFEFENQDVLSTLRQEVRQNQQAYIPGQGDITTELDQKLHEFKLSIINDAGVQLIVKTQQLFKEWKSAIYVQSQSLSFVVQQQKRAIIVCQNCPDSFDSLVSMRNVRFPDQDASMIPHLNFNTSILTEFRTKVQIIEFSITDRYQKCGLNSQIDNFHSSKNVNMVLQKLGFSQKAEDYLYFSCRDQVNYFLIQKNHIFGIWPKAIPTNGQQKALIFHEAVNLVYPNLTRESFRFRRDNELITMLEESTLKEQEHIWKYRNFNCKVCSISGKPFLAPYSQLQRHLHDQQHRNNINSLLSED